MSQTPKVAFANIAASTTAGNLVSAVPGKSIVVVAAFLVTGGTATDVTFNSASTAITSLIACGANGGAVLGQNWQGWFRTTPGQALTVTTGTGSTTGVNVNYLEI